VLTKSPSVFRNSISQPLLELSRNTVFCSSFVRANIYSFEASAKLFQKKSKKNSI